MRNRDTIVVQDPEIVEAARNGGETVDTDEFVEEAYDSVTFITNEGNEYTIGERDQLWARGELHGTVTRIFHHVDDATYNKWEWTIYFAYIGRPDTEGGVPLGEIAAQLDEGAHFEENTDE